MEEQFSASNGRMVLPVSMRILTDMRIQQPGFIAFDGGIAFPELDLARFGGFHLGAGQHHACFEPVHQEVVMAGLAIVTQNFEFSLFSWQTWPQITLNTETPLRVSHT